MLTNCDICESTVSEKREGRSHNFIRITIKDKKVCGTCIDYMRRASEESKGHLTCFVCENNMGKGYSTGVGQLLCRKCFSDITGKHKGPDWWFG